jgi:hypothetical protein
VVSSLRVCCFAAGNLFSADTPTPDAIASFEPDPYRMTCSMKALNSASDRSPPASVWLLEMNDSAPPVVRRSVAPVVSADLRPSRNDSSMSFACSPPALRACSGQSAGTPGTRRRSEPDASNGVRKICVLFVTFDGLSERAGLLVSFSGCAVPMMYSSSPLFIAAAVDPIPRVTCQVVRRHAVDAELLAGARVDDLIVLREVRPVRHRDRRRDRRGAAPFCVSNRALCLSSSHENFVATVAFLPRRARRPRAAGRPARASRCDRRGRSRAGRSGCWWWYVHP